MDNKDTALDINDIDTIQTQPKSCREKLRPYLRHRWFHQVVLILIILDAIIVLLALLIDLDVIPVAGESPEDQAHNKEEIEDGLHYTSLIVLSVFLIEIIVKLYVERSEFFHDHLEMFDAFIVITSFLLDIALTIAPISRAVADVVALMIIFRLWRFIKLISYVNIFVRKEINQKLEDEVKARHQAENEVSELKKQVEELQNQSLSKV